MSMQLEVPANVVLATAVSAQRPRTNARLRPISARIVPRSGTGSGVEPEGPQFPIEPVLAWLLAGVAVYLAVLIAGT